MNQTIEKALTGDKWSIAKLISLFEDQRAESRSARIQVMQELEQLQRACPGRLRQAHFFGFTGAPGSGKSTLIGEIALRLLALRERSRVAILAVDPSSQNSGGSLLGDRTRMAIQRIEQRLFIRSQATGGRTGGIGRGTFLAARLLHYFFDYLLIETVGSGQSEVEIGDFTDHLFLVLQPLAGDQLQYMKAGIMETPDAFIMNKCDSKSIAKASLQALQSSRAFIRPGAAPLPILATSAHSGQGLGELTEMLLQMATQAKGQADSQAKGQADSQADRQADDQADRRARQRGLAEKEEKYLKRWIREEFGRIGVEHLRQAFHANVSLLSGAILEERQISFEESFRNSFSRDSLASSYLPDLADRSEASDLSNLAPPSEISESSDLSDVSSRSDGPDASSRSDGSGA